jgi:hypothetical protein
MYQVTANPKYACVAVDRDLGLPILIALLRRGNKMLAPVLDPFQRAADEQRGEARSRRLLDRTRAWVEAATDIRGDDAHGFQSRPTCRL